ncbi:hypothetical protein [Bosea sp. (in: a-proteobacteria)]|uniref:hypothetical protein n=1 Tax=Bosea sp. (in: a-proteobacteria) TaxID=1871050 RepID=UPI002FC634BA
MKPIRVLSAVLFACLVMPHQASATMPLAPAATFSAPELVEMVQYRGGMARRGVAVGPRGGVVAGRGYAARGPAGAVAGRGYVARGPRGNVVAGRTGAAWVRPNNYWWHPGMAIASGAAIGFVAAAAATAYATSPAPAPGYCWYYTDAQRSQGFWDVCPR